MITLQDKELLAKKGISEEQIAEQLACFEKGFPYLKLSAAASVEQGILAPDADEQKKYLNAWETYTQTDKTVVKFRHRARQAVCLRIYLNSSERNTMLPSQVLRKHSSRKSRSLLFTMT